MNNLGSRLQGCPHEGAHPLRQGAYACPIGRCRCCGHNFAYIDSGGGGPEGGVMRYHDPDLCDACGGGYHETRWGAGA
jgi:hypothetical protein